MPSPSPRNSATYPVRMVLCCLALLLFSRAVPCQAAITSVNIPLDSPVYLYLEKLSGFGLITSDIRGIKPFSKAEAARLTLEAEKNLASGTGNPSPFAADLILRLRAMLPREILLRTDPPAEAKTFDYNLLSAARLRGVWLDGAPRSYERLVQGNRRRRRLRHRLRAAPLFDQCLGPARQ